MLSAVVLTLNEGKSLPCCLASVAFCDEIVVIDDCSTDRTVAIAKNFGAKVFIRALKANFADQRNFGLEKTSGDWVLFVDADEEVSPSLASEIKEKIRNSKKVNGFRLRRLDLFFGQKLWHGETGNFREIRLGRKNQGTWERSLHEQWKITGEVSELKNYLIHHSHPSISQFVDQINYYTDLDTFELSKEGKNFRYVRVVLNPLGKFLQNYFLKLGFLDGFPGFVMAFMMSLYSLIVRIKQYDLSQTS